MNTVVIIKAIKTVTFLYCNDKCFSVLNKLIQLQNIISTAKTIGDKVGEFVYLLKISHSY